MDRDRGRGSATDMARILYLTQDGITAHIGQSQIAPYLLRLARLGHQIHIVSAEKMDQNPDLERYQRVFDQAGIRWSPVRYRPPLLRSFYMMLSMWRTADRVAKEEQPDIVHCRSYLPLGIAAWLKRKYGFKYLADFRDFWADARAETKRPRFVYRWFRKRESATLGPADHVVTLTHRAADILISRHPHLAGGSRVNYTIVPCCADFELFDPATIPPLAVEARRRSLDIPKDATVLLYLGSLGSDYLLPEMISLFRELRALRSNAIFLFVANNGAELVKQQAAVAGVPLEALRFTSCSRSDVPEHIATADLSVVFIRSTISKAACSPTKVGELFAMNVPIIVNKGVGDLDHVVNEERNSSVVVPDFRPETLRGALESVLARPFFLRKRIRPSSADLSIEEGVRRYDSVYNKLAPGVTD